MRHEVTIPVSCRGVHDIIGIMTYAISELDAETILLAEDNAKYYAEKYGWEKFSEAFSWYEAQYGKVLNPTELVWMFHEPTELKRFTEYWGD